MDDGILFFPLGGLGMGWDWMGCASIFVEADEKAGMRCGRGMGYSLSWASKGLGTKAALLDAGTSRILKRSCGC